MTAPTDLRKIANCAVPTVAEVCALAQAELSRREAAKPAPVACLDCGKTHEGESDVYPFVCSKCGMELPFGDYHRSGAGHDYVRTCWACAAIETPTPPAKVTEPWKPVAIIDEATVRNAILQLQKRVEALEGRGSELS